MSAPPVSNAKRIRLHFKCKGIADMDTFSKSDPYVVLYANPSLAASSSAASFNRPRVGSLIQSSSGSYSAGTNSRYGREIGRTETIMNNLNPVFDRGVDMQFLFEARQDLTAVVYDYDGSNDDSKNDVCGFAHFQLSHVICSSSGRKEFPLALPLGGTKGTIEVSFSEVGTNSRDTVRIGLRGSGLISMSMFGGLHAYYTLSRIQPNGTRKLLHKSETIKGTTPRFSVTPQLPISELTGQSEHDEVIELELFAAGSFYDTGMGICKLSLAELKRAHEAKTSFAPRKAKDTSKHYGDIFVDVMDFQQFPSFAQSLASGWQINMALSIDFTGSNGDPRSSTSLHYMDPSRPNQYVQAMMSVGDILMEYDTDKQIPVFGFGASVNRVTTHFFNVNMQSDPYVSGIQGALNVYGAFLPTCILSGPTNFAPTILSVTAGARQSEAQRVYTVLLIITDGEITDMRETIDALVMADDAPLSIVIVGVGMTCDFEMMNELDGDDAALRASNGRISRRDLVQFVPYRDFAPPKPREALAAEVLREIPDQFEEYLMLANQRTGAAARQAAAFQAR